MGVVSLHQAGLLFLEVFDSDTLDPRWEFVPDDPARRERTAEGALRLLHGADPLLIFRSDLSAEKRWVLDVKNAYNPLTGEDFGGLTVYADESDNLKLEEYFDSQKGTANSYPWLRLVRDYNTYSAYWSHDGALWHFLGTEEFDRTSPKIGLFLAGGSGQPLDLELIRACRSDRVQVGNLAPGAHVTLLDAEGAEVETKVCRSGQTGVSFSLPALPFAGRFRVTLDEGSTSFEDTELLPLWGGDDYLFSPSVDLFYVDETGAEVPLIESLEQFLGYVNTGVSPFREIRMLARNTCTFGTFDQLRVEPAESHGTDHYSRLVELAADLDGAAGSYGADVALASLAAGEERAFWLKIHRETDPLLLEKTTHVFFRLQVTSLYSF